MAIKMIFDPAYNVQSPTMVLTYKSGRSIGAILPHNLHYADSLNSHNEFSFDVYKSVDGIECKHWSKITDFKLVYCVEWDAYFEIYVEIDESNETIKHILGRALSEAELAQVKLYGLEINTELDILRDDYEPTIIYNKEKESVSLLHKLLEKMPNFIIGHVDASIAKLQRTFTFDDKTIYDAFQEVAKEINCLFEFVAKKGENGQIERIINVYDLLSFCNECGCREIESEVCPNYASNPTGHSDYNGTDIRRGFGEDTTVFISTRNLADNITYTSDADSVKNCFKLTAGDDLMTATVRNCSPSKSGYLWHFTEETKANMSDELKEKIEGYESYSQQCKDEYLIFDENRSYMWGNAFDNYKTVVEKYNPYVDNGYSVLSGNEKGYSTLMKLYYDAIDLELLLRNKLMPKADLEDTTANEQIELLRSNLVNTSVAVLDHQNISEVAAGNAVENMARIFVDSRYRIETTTKNYNKSSGLWTGDFTITRYTNEEDTAEIQDISITVSSDYSEYTKQKIEKKLYKETEEAVGIVSLFNLEQTTDDEFKAELKKYCLNSLTSFRDACQACLDMMIELGITNKNSQTEGSTSYIQGAAELYTELYKPYWNRRNWIDEEIGIRNTEINQVTGYYNINGQLIKYGMMTYLEWVINAIQSSLDLEDYMKEGKTEEEALNLLSELASFRREDTYQNDNFISDGLDNAELFAKALEFIEEAEKDIKTAAVPVHTISSTLKNLLVMKEFAPIVNNFKVGNWIRVEIDEQIYKLRLIKYEINFSDLDNIEVEFSDVQAVKDSTADIQSILNQASTIASNYSNIKILANQNKKTGEYVWEWVNEGLSLTKMKIIDSAENQNISWDENGFLCREYSPITDAYDKKQLKIINKGLYVTDDNWLTSKAGIGNFIYYDPKETDEDKKYKEGYGVIADTLVGNLILSKEVGIYNENNSVQIDKDGFVITTKSGNDTVFKIQKETSEDTFDNLLFVDNEGNLHIKGDITATRLELGDNVDLRDKIDLDGYVTSEDLNGYAKSEEINKALENYAKSSDLNNYLLTKKYEDTDHIVFGVSRGQDNSGENYFVVNKDGLLTARNAVIYGTIYASAGEFAGELKSGYTNNGYNFKADDNGIYIGRLSNGNYSMSVGTDGKIIFGNGVSLSWDNLPSNVANTGEIPTNTSDLRNDSGFAYTNNIPSDADIADISKTTITKDYIETLNIKAGSVSSDWVYAGNLLATQINSGYLTSNNYNSGTTLGGTAGSIIDMSNGHFNFGGGKLLFDGMTLSVTGHIEATTGSFGDELIVSDDGVRFGNWLIRGRKWFYDSLGDFNSFIYAPGSNSSRCAFIATGYKESDYLEGATDDPLGSDFLDLRNYSTFAVYHDGRLHCDGEIKTKNGLYVEAPGDDGYVKYFSATQSGVTTTGTITATGRVTFNGGLDIKDSGYSVLSTSSGGISVSALAATGYISCAGALNIGADNITINAATNGDSTTLETRVATFKVDRDMYFTKTNGVYSYETGYNLLRIASNGYAYLSDSNIVITYIDGKDVKLKTANSISSDERLKSNIESFSETQEKFFASLRPSSFKYINGTSDRTHYGFIAQEVRDAALSAGLTTQDIAAFVSIPNEDFDNGEEYSLRYDEFISLNTHMIQKCLAEINTLKIENETLKKQVESIKQVM